MRHSLRVQRVSRAPFLFAAVAEAVRMLPSLVRGHCSDHCKCGSCAVVLHACHWVSSPLIVMCASKREDEVS